MNEYKEYNHYSVTRSWLYWKKKIAEHPELSNGYEFPQPIQAWRTAMGNICPICDGGNALVRDIGDGPEKIYCICSLLIFMHNNYYDLLGGESPHKPAYLKDLKPLGIDPVADGILLHTIDHITNWLEELDSWIILLGPNGVGKTHMLRAIKTHLGSICAFISADKFQQDLFSARNKDGQVEALVERLSKIPVLLLDDWGIEHESSWTTDTLASIINFRYSFSDALPTVVSSNLTMKDLMGTPDYARKRIASRLLDSKISTVIELQGRDYRSKTTQNEMKAVKKKQYTPSSAKNMLDNYNG